jgi:hypothetical protein
MTALQIIIKEAKVIWKKHPKLSWQEAIKKASTMYKSKHKPKKSGKAIVGKRIVKKSAPKKIVSGLDSVLRKKNKTQVNYSKMGSIETQLKRKINGRTYVCEFITADKHKADIKLKAYKEIGILSRIFKLSKDRRPVYGVFVQ